MRKPADSGASRVSLQNAATSDRQRTDPAVRHTSSSAGHPDSGPRARPTRLLRESRRPRITLCPVLIRFEDAVRHRLADDHVEDKETERAQRSFQHAGESFEAKAPRAEFR